MYFITNTLHFCYGHRLLGHKGKCSRLHGHNAVLELTLGALSLNKDGMVADFSDVKAAAGKWIDETLDHKMLLNRMDPAVGAFKKLGEEFMVFDSNPTAEVLAKFIFNNLKGMGLTVKEVKLWETPTSCAVYKK